MTLVLAGGNYRGLPQLKCHGHWMAVGEYSDSNTKFARTGGLNLKEVVRPERFELPTSSFGGKRSIHLSYGRMSSDKCTLRCLAHQFGGICI
jgi:hypothetical protein